MPRFKTVQNRFTQGEIDPLMLGRGDVDQYYGAAEKLRNVVTLPQGGIRRRPGLEYIDQVLGVLTLMTPSSATAPNGGTAAQGYDDDTATTVLTTTNISTTNPYVVLRYDAGAAVSMGVVYIYDLKLSATGSSDEFFVQVSNDDSTWTTVGAALEITEAGKDFTRRIHGSWRYIRLARIGATDLGTRKVELDDMLVYTEGDLSNTKIVQFEFNVNQTYVLVFSDKNIAIYQNGVYLIDLRAADYTSARIPYIDWLQRGDSLLVYHEDVATQLIQRQGANDVWSMGAAPYTNIPRYAFTEVSTTSPGGGTLTPSAVDGNITLTASAAVSFVQATHVGQYLEGNGGRARILNVRSTTVVDAYVEIPFINTTAIANGLWTLLTGYEEIWSVSRGWPRHAAEYQGRIWIDGGKSRPTVVYGSTVNQFFDYDFGIAQDDQAIGPLSFEGFNNIEAIYPGRALMVFTSSAEFILPQPLGDPLTPLTTTVARQSKIGSKQYMRPQETDGGVLYVQLGGRAVQELIFDDTQNAFSNNLISLMSGHLIDDPVDFSLRRSTSTEDGSYLLMVLGDGTLTMANVLRAQGIAAFVKQTTAGLFKNCAADVDDMYFIVYRTIAGTPVQYLERFNDDHYTDCSTRFTTGLPEDEFSAPQLTNMVCRVLADGAVMEDQSPDADGDFTIERDATDSLEIGLNFNIQVKDLPVEKAFPGFDSLMGMPKNVSEIALRLQDTAGILINGKVVSFRGFGPSGGGSPLDSGPESFTGVHVAKGWRGWTEGGQVEITQVDPLPFTLLSMSKRVNV